jgi:signal transduction histidine kinase
VARAYLWLQRHPRVIDLGLVALLLLIGLPSVMLGTVVRGPSAGRVLYLVVCLPLLWRRSRAVTAVLACGGLGLVQLVIGTFPSFSDLALAVAVYSAAAFGPRWLSLLSLAGGLVAPVLAIWRWSRVPVDSEATVYMYLVLVTPFLIGWILGWATHYRRAYLAGVEDRAARLEHERDAQARIAVSAERARIAREMHDVVAHAVSVMVVQAAGAAYALDSRPDQTRRALDAIADTGRQTLAELRRVLGVMRADDPTDGYVPQPGVAQVVDLVGQVRATGLPADLDVEGVPVELSPGGQLAVYRVVQEALTNVVKHAGPRATARVLIRYGEEAMDIEVDDDGRGAAADPAGGGHGLVGMRERVALFDGELDAGPRPGGGYRVRVRLPMTALAPATAATAVS